MGNSPHKMNHKRNKNIRNISKDDYIPDDNHLKPKDYQDDEPPSDFDGQKRTRYTRSKSHLDSMKDGMQQKKSKFHSKRAKFQNPDEVDYETEPESIHVEGAKWIQVVKMQAIDRAKKLKKRLERYFGKR
ncbi:MAG: hypothetical protein Tsb0015_00260 [Simkaniaceae bacterium]